MKARLILLDKSPVDDIHVDGDTSAGVVLWCGRCFVQTALNNELWPEIVTYQEKELCSRPLRIDKKHEKRGLVKSGI